MSEQFTPQPIDSVMDLALAFQKHVASRNAYIASKVDEKGENGFSGEEAIQLLARDSTLMFATIEAILGFLVMKERDDKPRIQLLS